MTRRTFVALLVPALVAAAGCGGDDAAGQPNPDLKIPVTGKRPPRDSPGATDPAKKKADPAP